MLLGLLTKERKIEVYAMCRQQHSSRAEMSTDHLEDSIQLREELEAFAARLRQQIAASEELVRQSKLHLAETQRYLDGLAKKRLTP